MKNENMDPAPQYTPQQWERLAILAEDHGDALTSLIGAEKYGKPAWLPEPLKQMESRLFRKERKMAETFNADMADIEARIISYVEGDLKITKIMDEILIEKIETEPEHLEGLA